MLLVGLFFFKADSVDKPEKDSLVRLRVQERPQKGVGGGTEAQGAGIAGESSAPAQKSIAAQEEPDKKAALTRRGKPRLAPQTSDAIKDETSRQETPKHQLDNAVAANDSSGVEALGPAGSSGSDDLGSGLGGTGSGAALGAGTGGGGPGAGGSGTGGGGFGGADANSGANLAKEREIYALGVRKSLAATGRYPMVAKRLGLSGQVVLMLKINERGQLTESLISQPSQHPELNSAAVASAKRLGSFKPPPGGAIDLLIPIEFKLR
ncbi:MAG: Gram-negative bacterial tonB protein [Deltaproteobacteria bacterium ADurb.Bin058]|jgi:TonB family protein|nr:MAG: Gram-negative bacterial tonB protein [Deltaproteobacteria bacterium ADurb.Bin058]